MWFELTPSFALLLCIILFVLYSLLQFPSRHALPPGPKPWPLIGNILDMPRKDESATFSQWGRTYGDIVYVRLLRRPLIILNSFEAATELMERRYTIYSDRPEFPMMNLIGHQWNLGFKPFGDEWATLRKLFTSKFSNGSALRAYQASQTASNAELLQSLLKDPNGFVEHIALRATQVVIDVTYGISVTSPNDHLIVVAERVMNAVSIALSPPLWIINPVSLVRSFMSLFGGLNSISIIRKWRSDLEELRNGPFEEAKLQLTKGHPRPSVVGNLLQDLGENGTQEAEELIRDCAAVAYGGAAETSTSSSLSFILAMVLNPSAMRKAQDELDRVVGNDRLPCFEDRPNLPYVTGMMKEVLRFHPPGVVGVPRQLKQDDEYKGYHIPAGSMVMVNIDGLMSDPSLYPEPEMFMPERYIVNGKFDCSRSTDPSRIAFGFGRRVCPGKLFAEDSLWIVIAQMLAVFTISPVDEKHPPPLSFEAGAISRPSPFPCIIRPRSEAAKHLVESAL
ncbi:cytochrome P450 [Stereum hirsutum FP-91666 SS1]|uniref:Cytochrome P450 n=1 Tax=Stereum hirsutum (strain FP-91666) TaxID=721885 RepID=R7RXP1_STEHR|nr:cytochrome P450 [Stereum hirsutum FP-91666 SS1]EIM79553.1 cytochrome P450 [Stereum hirsutum FP-91666 SS1]